MKILTKTALAAAVAMGIGSVAHAGVVIDLFTDPAGGEQSVETATLNGTDFSQAGPFATSNVLGGYRDLQITKTGDNVGDANSGDSSLVAGGGVLAHNNDVGNKSVGLVTWDGNDAANSVDIDGLNGVDLTLGNADRFLAQVIEVDLGFDYVIRVWDMDGDLATLSSSVLFAVQPEDNITADYLFDWFNLGTGVYTIGGLTFAINGTANSIDFTRIGALQLETSNSSTFSVDLAIGTITTVPEPGAVALVGIGLLGLAAARIRRRSRKA